MIDEDHRIDIHSIFQSREERSEEITGDKEKEEDEKTLSIPILSLSLSH
jgi:hypothetical protein